MALGGVGVGDVFNGPGAALDRSRCPTEDAPDDETLPDGDCCDLKGKKNREPPELGPDERVRGMVDKVKFEVRLGCGSFDVSRAAPYFRSSLDSSRAQLQLHSLLIWADSLAFSTIWLGLCCTAGYDI